MRRCQAQSPADAFLIGPLGEQPAGGLGRGLQEAREVPCSALTSPLPHSSFSVFPYSPPAHVSSSSSWRAASPLREPKCLSPLLSPLGPLRTP